MTAPKVLAFPLPLKPAEAAQTRQPLTAAVIGVEQPWPRGAADRTEDGAGIGSEGVVAVRDPTGGFVAARTPRRFHRSS